MYKAAQTSTVEKEHSLFDPADPHLMFPFTIRI